MKTNANFFNFADMLRLGHDEINNIAAQNFTLDELDELEKFLYILGTGYNVNNIDEMHKDYLWKHNQYEMSVKNIPMEELDDADWLDEEFFTLKLIVEDMANTLVLDGPCFFSEARR